MSKKEYNFIDLFAGCGGLSEGFMQTGCFDAVAHVEWELPMVETLRKRLATHWGYSEEESKKRVVHFDVQCTDELMSGDWNSELMQKYAKTNSDEIVNGGISNLIGTENVDLVIGGPPCQAYSIHGRATDSNSMSEDYRNYLFESFVKVVSNVKPKIFVFENVPGILTAKPGGTKITDRIHKAFDEIGYNTLDSNDWGKAIFNAADFEVPQNRKRVIIIGVRKNGRFCLDELYNSIRGEISNNIKTVFDAIGGFPSIEPLSKPIKVNGKNISHKVSKVGLLQHDPRYNNERDISIFREWVSKRLNYAPHKEKIAYYYAQTGRKTLYSKYRNLEWDKQSPTVVAHLYKDGLMFIHPDEKQARSITIREAAALMTFPLDYEFVGTNAYCYKMIGNAVPVKFAKAIATALYKVIKSKE